MIPPPFYGDLYLVFLTDAFERLLVRLLVHEAAGVRVPFCPPLVPRVKDLRSTPNSPIAMPITCWRICRHSVLRPFVGQCVWRTMPSAAYTRGP